jgi:hypothetical protein
MRSFLTRILRSAAAALFLTSGLLTCLACATPFLAQRLEEGMTPEAVRQTFGAPIETESEGAESAWVYIHEELEPIPLEDGPMPLRVAVASIWGVSLSWGFALADLLTDELAGENWNHMYVSRAPVVLHFSGGRLVRWEVLPDVRLGPSYYARHGPHCPYYERPFAPCPEFAAGHYDWSWINRRHQWHADRDEAGEVGTQPAPTP